MHNQEHGETSCPRVWQKTVPSHGQQESPSSSASRCETHKKMPLCAQTCEQQDLEWMRVAPHCSEGVSRYRLRQGKRGGGGRGGGVQRGRLGKRRKGMMRRDEGRHGRNKVAGLGGPWCPQTQHSAHKQKRSSRTSPGVCVHAYFLFCVARWTVRPSVCLGGGEGGGRGPWCVQTVDWPT